MEQSTATFDKLDSVRALKRYHQTVISNWHLKDMLDDMYRNDTMRHTFKASPPSQPEKDVFVLDYTHCKLDQVAQNLLLDVAEEVELQEKIMA